MSILLAYKKWKESGKHFQINYIESCKKLNTFSAPINECPCKCYELAIFMAGAEAASKFPTGGMLVNTRKSAQVPKEVIELAELRGKLKSTEASLKRLKEFSRKMEDTVSRLEFPDTTGK